MLCNLTLAVASILIALGMLEAAARVWGAEPVLRIADYRGSTLDVYRLGLPVQHDSLLGWIPQEGFAGSENRWHTRVTILDHGVRSNGDAADAADQSRPILTVGDSFTFGDEVSDSETWPAALERITGRRVVNGGVFAYGLDQSFLRLVSLLPTYEPTTAILSFIPEDIPRTEFAVALNAPKPYFAVAGDSLVLRNTPIAPAVGSRRPRFVTRALGHSYLAHRVMMRIAPSWWLQGGYRWNEAETGFDGTAISCLIARRLGEIAREDQFEAFVLVQDKKVSSLDQPSVAALVDSVLACVDREAVRVIDVRHALRAIAQSDPDRYATFFENHMTAAGNAFVAEQIADALGAGDASADTRPVRAKE